MASRFAIKSLRSAALARPAVPRVMAAHSVRSLATQPTPDEKAASIINAVPSTSLFTKTGGVLLGTGLTAAAVSTELYVANEETVLFVGWLVIATVIGKAVAKPYGEWARGQIEKMKGILNASREEHTRAVSERIDSVGALKEVVPLTESLYAVSKEINTLEHENFVLAQEHAVKAELKAVLDSWVRYEQQQREAEQVALVKSVQASVESEIAKPAFKKQLLEEALTQVEQLAKAKAI
ncbi:hypothetical protein IAT38_001233 [Cryptococcus sp. DSM 104549]